MFPVQWLKPSREQPPWPASGNPISTAITSTSARTSKPLTISLQTMWPRRRKVTSSTSHSPCSAVMRIMLIEVQKLLVRNCIQRLLPNPLVKTDLPSTAELTVTEQNGRRILHVLHYPAARRAPDLDIVEEVIPLSNVKHRPAYRSEAQAGVPGPAAADPETRLQRWLCEHCCSLGTRAPDGSLRTVMDSRFRGNDVIFERTVGDEESPFAFRARFPAALGMTG